MRYATALKKAMDEAPAALGLSRPEIERRIGAISEGLKRPERGAVMSRRPPSKLVFCQDCRRKLDYEVGSIRWCSRDDDYCASCEGKRAGEKVGARIRERIAALPDR